jgi:hypothetical protein
MCLWARFLSIAACLVNRKSQGLVEIIFVGRPYHQGLPHRTRNGLFPNPPGRSLLAARLDNKSYDHGQHPLLLRMGFAVNQFVQSRLTDGAKDCCNMAARQGS